MLTNSKVRLNELNNNKVINIIFDVYFWKLNDVHSKNIENQTNIN